MYSSIRAVKFHTVTTKPGTSRTPKVAEHQKRLIKLRQVQDDILSLTDLVRVCSY